MPPLLTDITLRRESGRALVHGVAHEFRRHSPDGFEWGYGGSGPADLALNILHSATLDLDFANRHYQDYKRDVIERLPLEGGTITLQSVREWVEARYARARS